MQQCWIIDEFIDIWMLLFIEIDLLWNKIGFICLGFVVMFKVFQYEGCFFYNIYEVFEVVVEYVVWQVGVVIDEYWVFNWCSCNSSYQCQDIWVFCGFCEFIIEDVGMLMDWLSQFVVLYEVYFGVVIEVVLCWFCENGIELFSFGWFQWFVDVVEWYYDLCLCQIIYDCLSIDYWVGLEVLLRLMVLEEDQLEDYEG